VVSQVVPDDALADLQAVPETVAVADGVRDYVVDVGRATREDDRVEVGVSPRGTQRLFEVARARAVIHGREYVTPDDVKRVALPVLVHRLVLTGAATVENTDPEDVVQDVLERVEVPAVS